MFIRIPVTTVAILKSGQQTSHAVVCRTRSLLGLRRPELPPSIASCRYIRVLRATSIHREHLRKSSSSPEVTTWKVLTGTSTSFLSSQTIARVWRSSRRAPTTSTHNSHLRVSPRSCLALESSWSSSILRWELTRGIRWGLVAGHVTHLQQQQKHVYLFLQHQRAHDIPAALHYSFHDVVTADDSAPRDVRELRDRCLNPGLYATHLDRWLTHFQRSQVSRTFPIRTLHHFFWRRTLENLYFLLFRCMSWTESACATTQ